ncbi:MAG: NHL repeat-containing protein [Thermomicrobiales bacterium]
MTTLPAFETLRQRFALTGGRRPLLGGLAALPLVGAGALLADEDAAAKAKRKGKGKPARKQHRKQQHTGAQAEKKAKKVTVCLNGQTVSAPKKKAKKLLKQGATNGACSGGGGSTTTSTSSTAAPCTFDHWTSHGSFGGPPSGGANDRFENPEGCALSSDGKTLWVADFSNNRVSFWTRSNATSTVWAPAGRFGIGTLDGPSAVALAPDEKTMWIANQAGGFISVWTRETASSNSWNHSYEFATPGSGDGNLNQPTAVSISADTCTLWVVDFGNNRVAVWSRANPSSITWNHDYSFGPTGSFPLSSPVGIVVSADTKTAWVSDSNNRINIWTRPDASSQVWTHAGKFGNGTGSGAAQFSSPRHLAMDSSELRLWIGDQSNKRVSLWTRATTSSDTWLALTTIGTSAQFASPYGVAVSRDGATLLVTDLGDDNVEMFTVDC